nr:hypothetical protein [Tanacetum cinerariifolium]
LLHLAGSQPMLKSSYKAKDGVIISISPLVEGATDVVVEIKGTGDRKPRKGQNRIKTGQKREAWRNQEKFKAVAVGRARKTEQNAKRMARNANAIKSYSSFKRKKKRKVTPPPPSATPPPVTPPVHHSSLTPEDGPFVQPTFAGAKRKSKDIGWEYGVITDPSNPNKIKCTLCHKLGLHRETDKSPPRPNLSLEGDRPPRYRQEIFTTLVKIPSLSLGG